MITTRRQLSFYIQSDMMINRGFFKAPFRMRFKNLFAPDYIMQFLVLMRKIQYYSNNHTYGKWGGGNFIYN